MVNATVGACDAIGLAGGLTENASLRNLTLLDARHDTKTRVDLFTWFFKGKVNQNKFARQG